MSSATSAFAAEASLLPSVIVPEGMASSLAHDKNRLGPQLYEGTPETDVQHTLQMLARAARQHLKRLGANEPLPPRLVVSVKTAEPLGYDTDILIPQGSEIFDAHTGLSVRTDAAALVRLNPQMLSELGLSAVDVRRYIGLQGVKAESDFPKAPFMVGIFALAQLADEDTPETPEAPEADQTPEQSYKEPSYKEPTYKLDTVFPSQHPHSEFDIMQPAHTAPSASFSEQSKQQGPTQSFSRRPPLARLILLEHLEKLSKRFKGPDGKMTSLYVPILAPQSATFRKRTLAPAPTLVPDLIKPLS